MVQRPVRSAWGWGGRRRPGRSELDDPLFEEQQLYRVGKEKVVPRDGDVAQEDGGAAEAVRVRVETEAREVVARVAEDQDIDALRACLPGPTPLASALRPLPGPLPPIS